MRHLRLGITVLVLLGILVSAAWAGEEAAPQQQPAPRPWAPMGANFGPSGSSMPAGVFAVGGNFMYGESDHVRRYSDQLNDNTKTDKALGVFKTRYGILPNLDIRTATPIYNINFDNQVASDKSYSGVGDTTVLLHSQILNQDKGAPFCLAVDYGGIVPTASVSGHSVNGIGNDAWGVMGGAGITYYLDSHRFDIEANYAAFTEGAHDYTKGDRIRFNQSYAYAISKMWDVGMESCYEWNGASELHGVDMKDSSEEWYVGPKVVLKYQPWGMNVGLAGMVPVQRWYQGNKAGSDDYRLDMKLIKFF